MQVSLAVTEAGHLAASPDAIRVDVRELALGEALRSTGGDVWVEVGEDLLNAPGEGAIHTEARRRAAEIDFGFTTRVDVPDGGTLHGRIQSALVSEEEQDSDVYFVLKTRDSVTGGEAELGMGYLNLEAMLKDGREKVRAKVVLSSSAGPVADLTVSLLACPVLRRVRDAPLPSGAKPPSSAAAKAATGAASASDDSSLRIGVGQLQLTKPLLGSALGKEVWIDVDLAHLGTTAGAATPPLPPPSVDSPTLGFGYSTEVAFADGELPKLGEALASSIEDESDVYFILRSRNAAGAEVDLAQGHVNLRSAMLTPGADVPMGAIDLFTEDGKELKTGALQVSVAGIGLLRKASLPRKPPPSLSVSIGALSLSSSVLRDVEATDVWVEVDLLDLLKGNNKTKARPRLLRSRPHRAPIAAPPPP